jgi:hypothetical protein
LPLSILRVEILEDVIFIYLFMLSLLIRNGVRQGFGFEIPGVFVFPDERYVEPSIRPDDSRYGENPNRLQRHTQFQVNFDTLFEFRI